MLATAPTTIRTNPVMASFYRLYPVRVNYQVAIDCADPHLLAKFWSGALHWTIEDNSDTIKSLLD